MRLLLGLLLGMAIGAGVVGCLYEPALHDCEQRCDQAEAQVSTWREAATRFRANADEAIDGWEVCLGQVRAATWVTAR